ncbi:hypothetical protein [Gloeobacter kilaueensis]|uniref:Uncharacterized protein n=1 Tax=Gloeobacter kilaueensis (strain ATCC BAA-2537 / CCAP 1431/1 / ULC 316 / JS1) TaxID=1183438 RepID=U5QEY8_GLOK1|nr:hypothetical protein [Gloeobacter kilaueensis]AGY57418.1 hypothetical protein GKIL_1172 [Gloeobacter kilaueensis JS1]
MFSNLKQKRLAHQGRAPFDQPSEAPEVLEARRALYLKRAKLYEKHRKTIVSVLENFGEALFIDVPFKVEDCSPLTLTTGETLTFRAVLKVVKGSKQLHARSLFAEVVYVEADSGGEGFDVSLEPKLAWGSKTPLVHSQAGKDELVRALETLAAENQMARRQFGASSARSSDIATRFL